MARVHRALSRNLVRRALAQEPALAGVDALGVLAHDDAVDPGVQRARPGLERTQAHVQDELEAQPEEQAPLEHAGRDVGGPHRAEQHGVEVADLPEHRIGEDLAGAQVACAAEVERHGLVGDTGRVDDLERLGDDLGADAVTADDPDAVGHGAVLLLRFPDKLPRTKNRPPKWTVEGERRAPAFASE